MKSEKKICEFIRANYLVMNVKQMAAKLQRSETLVKTRLRSMNLVRPPELVEQFRQVGRFKAGDVPFSKGRRQRDFTSREGIARSSVTRFKKGCVSPNTLSDGAITLRTDKRGVEYKFIRLAPMVWIPLQRHVWQQANGEIPKGMKIAFRDGDTMNCALDNLDMLTPAEMLKRNSFHNLPKPLAELVQLRGALTRQINKKNKTHE